MTRLGMSQTGFFILARFTSRKLLGLGGPYVRHLDVEVERLACQRVVEIDHDGFIPDLVDTEKDGPSVRALAHQHGANREGTYS
jgi:hypothetical protein